MEQTNKNKKQPAIHFFKVIRDPEEESLIIPKAFTRRYGDTLKESLSLKLRTGASWPVRVVRQDGEAWLGKGWKEFAKHYSIQQAYFVVFRYDGTSQLFVMIHDATGLEIDYACDRRPKLDAYCENSMSDIGNDIEDTSDDDVSVEMLEPTEIRRRQKKELIKFDNVSEEDDNPEPVCKKLRKNHHHVAELVKSPQSTPSVKEERIEETDRHSKSKMCNKQTITDIEQFPSYQRAKAFKSENPFFIRFMQATYVRRTPTLTCPSSFIRRYITTQDNVKSSIAVLDPLGKKWEVACTLRSNNAHWTGPGWRELVRENSLEFADVCVFELVGHKVFNLRIYRRLNIKEPDVAKIDYPYNIPGHDRYRSLSCGKMKALRENDNDVDDISEDGSIEILEAEEVQVIRKELAGRSEADDVLENGQTSTVILDDISDPEHKKQKIKHLNNQDSNDHNGGVRKAKLIKLHEDMNLHSSGQNVGEGSWEENGRLSKSTPLKNHTIVNKEQFASYQEAKTFQCKNPFFISFMQPSYVSGHHLYLHMPFSFAKRYLSNKRSEKFKIVVCDPLGRRREVTCILRARDAQWRGLGWREFVQENNLKFADVCVFELVGDNVFNVTIYRQAEH